MTESPDLDEFIRLVDQLKRNAALSPHIRKGEIVFKQLTLEEISVLLRDEAARYFLLAAAGLNRTALKRAAADDTAKIVTGGLRKAFAVKVRLPVRKKFVEVADKAIVLRRGDLDRRTRGGIEALFRERLHAEGIPILMSPPVRYVPGLLINKRKPDGIYPDPSTRLPPSLYLEIKNVRRVSDDIQKRLYEVAEAALEMKILYGNIDLQGFAAPSTDLVLERASEYRQRLREKIKAARPVVVVLLLCPRAEAERYREGAEAFVDRVFFQEEIDECLGFLKQAVASHTV
jgi:hypothetical protein